MQFQYNSDYPGLSSGGQPIPVDVRNPKDFPPAQPLPCARITTRVYHPSRRQVATVQNVLVRTMIQPVLSSDTMSSSSSDDLSSDESMTDLQDVGNHPSLPLGAVLAPVIQEDRAYWVQRTIREAIYGRVLFAVVLRRRTPSQAANDNADWEVTEQFCAVKEMSWQHIRKERDRLAEDPIKEVSAMQYIRKWHMITKAQRNGQQYEPVVADGVVESFQAILETNIMMPLDLLTDDRHLYSIMPYCDGGELFERLDLNERFSEEEARYWMVQMLNGLENLQNAGICHRDMSLENLLVHESGALIIDMGMCLRVPLDDQDNELSQSMQNMHMNGAFDKGSAVGTDLDIDLRARTKRRHLLRPQGTCGKWIYMSPEIYKNQEPFDGYTVDMWAAGVVLFLMLTGFPPWERACQTDERFKYMTAGYLVQMLTEWDLGLSSDAMDLLQRMLFLDPKDRLSLDQVRAHPWMTNGRLAGPVSLSGFD